MVCAAVMTPGLTNVVFFCFADKRCAFFFRIVNCSIFFLSFVSSLKHPSTYFHPFPATRTFRKSALLTSLYIIRSYETLKEQDYSSSPFPVFSLTQATHSSASHIHTQEDKHLLCLLFSHLSFVLFHTPCRVYICFLNSYSFVVTMGFCHRCGDLVHGTNCLKCGGRSVSMSLFF